MNILIWWVSNGKRVLLCDRSFDFLNLNISKLRTSLSSHYKDLAFPTDV